MSLERWGTAAALVVALVGLIWQGIKAISDARAGVHARHSTERRDTVADRDALIDQMQEEITALRLRLDRVEAELAIERAHSRQLVDQIYRGEGPPPRPRPTTA